MSFTLKLGSVDLSGYVRVSQGEGFDPYDNDWVEPQFVESPLGEGQPLSHLNVRNREMAWPLFLNATSKDSLHSLVRTVNQEIAKTPPLRVEWRDDGASDSTFYDIIFARLEPDYNFRRSQKNWAGFILRVWTTGYGHTATYITRATDAGTAVAMRLAIPSVAGDAPAQMEARIVTGSYYGWLGRHAGIAALPHPSYVFDWAAPSITRITSNASLVGATDAQGSQAVALLRATALPSAPLASYRSAVQITLSPASVYAGQRHRLFALAQANTLRGAILQYAHAGGVGPSAVASFSHQGYQLTDLGVISIPSNPAGSYPITLQVGGGPLPASGRLKPDAVVASQPYGLCINRLLLWPEDKAQVLVDSFLTPVAGDNFPATTLPTVDKYGNPYTLVDTDSMIALPVYGMVATISGNAYTTRAVHADLPETYRDVVFQSTIRVPASAAAINDANGLSAMLRLELDSDVSVAGAVTLASGWCGLSAYGATVPLASSAYAYMLMEIGKVGTSVWVSARSLGPGVPAFASMSLATVFDRPVNKVGWWLSATHSVTVASMLLAIDDFTVYAAPSQGHAARGVYRINEGVERADASANTIKDVSAKAYSPAVRISPSQPALGVFAHAPRERANDVISANIALRERFYYAR